METLDNFPVKFSNEEEDCPSYDNRTFCQLAQQSDKLVFFFEPSIGEELLFCNYFDDGCCFSAGGGETGCEETDQYWSSANTGVYTGGWAWNNDDSVMCNNDGGPLMQENFLEETGYYRVEVTVAGYPNNIDNTGTFKITLGNATQENIPTTSGSHIYYLNVTSISFTGIKIQGSDGSIFCISYASVKKVCTDYSIRIKDLDDTTIITIDSTYVGFESEEGIFFYGGIMYVNFTWSILNLSDGCYKICIVDDCASVDLVVNGTFDEDYNEDGNVDSLDFFASWSVEGGETPGWSLGGGGAKACHPSGNTNKISQELTGATVGRVYVVAVTVSGRTTGSVTVKFDGVTLGSLTTNGTYTYNATALTTTPLLEFIPISSFDGCIDNISAIFESEVCSECYALSSSHDCTKLLSWTNDDDAFGVPYSSIEYIADPPLNYMRVKAILKPAPYRQEQEDFMDSGGEESVMYFSNRKIMELFIDDIPEYMHDAIAIGKGHDHFYIDGVEYSCEKGYEPEWDEEGKIKTAKSRFLVSKKTQNLKNKLC